MHHFFTWQSSKVEYQNRELAFLFFQMAAFKTKNSFPTIRDLVLSIYQVSLFVITKGYRYQR